MRLPSVVPGGNEILADERLAKLELGAFGGVDVRSDHDHALGLGVLQVADEGVVVDERRDQRVGLARQRRLLVGDLLFDRPLGLGEDHLAIRLHLRAGVIEALLDRLPERV